MGTNFLSGSKSWGGYTNYFSLSLTVGDTPFGLGGINVLHLSYRPGINMRLE